MRNITVKTHPSSSLLKKEDQLAWKIAEIAADKSRPSADTIEMVINRIIDNASVAISSLNRKPVISARDMALSAPQGVFNAIEEQGDFLDENIIY